MFDIGWLVVNLAFGQCTHLFLFGECHVPPLQITALGEIPDSVRRLPSHDAHVSASRAQLLLAEVTVALELLSAGGGLVLLVDDFTSSHSLQLAYLLVCCFHEVSPGLSVTLLK